VKNLDVAESALLYELTREANCILASLDPHDSARRTHTLREKLKTSSRTAANLDDMGTDSRPDLIKHPA
jgi:hypothetical protein